ncbi:Carbonyl reductase [NADPH] 1 [Papilio machaon]|uniref:Carbonyl reductase [NADPH] 1 n=1 Tax=Papilio machaon TaxID=76193 RepID=A0A0N1I4U5_PAPMA|nr:short-chain dehydrogenase/reductase eriB [Papilio machaon]KPJ07379.1 Carbonyl reductase [NADPH] 1 [Papilio machaon]
MAPDNSDKAVFNTSIILDTMTNVALVVGAASNLGFHVLKKLTTLYKGKIYFTTEDASTGYNIQETLEGTADVEFIQMDITYTKSIIKLRHHIQDLDERIDLLINNTEYVPTDKKITHAEKVRRTLSVNFYGYINFGKLVYPILSENARVVNVSGPAGLLATIENEDIRRRISDPYLTEDELVAIMQEYEEAARKGIEKTEGWGMSVTAVSKVSLNAVTFLQHREWSDKGIVINCVNPGNVSTREGRKTAKVYEEGAKAILYLALEAPLSIKGNFVWSNYNVIEWNSDPYVEVTTV